MEKERRVQAMPIEKPAKNKESSESTLEQRGWTKELLEMAQKAVMELADAGRVLFTAPSIEGLSQQGLDLGRDGKKMELRLPPDTQKALATAAATLVAAGGILSASPAYAGIQRETLKEAGETTKTYTLQPGTQEFEVLAGAENLDIGDVPGFKKESKGNRTIYRPDGALTAPATLSIKLNIPQSKKGTELTVRTNTSHDNDLQLFEGAGGKMRWIIGEDASQSTSLKGIAGVEGSLMSHAESKGEKESGWRVPVGLRIMQGNPDSAAPLALGLSSGFAYWNSDIGEIKGEVGTTFDPKTLKGSLGREALLALSYSRKAGKLELHADVLSTLGAEGKTAAELGVDLETKRIPTPGGDVVISSGLGLSTEGWRTGKGTAEKSRLHITPAKISFPFLGQEVTLAPSITRDLYRGDTGGAVDLSVKPEKK